MKSWLKTNGMTLVYMTLVTVTGISAMVSISQGSCWPALGMLSLPLVYIGHNVYKAYKWFQEIRGLLRDLDKALNREIMVKDIKDAVNALAKEESRHYKSKEQSNELQKN